MFSLDGVSCSTEPLLSGNLRSHALFSLNRVFTLIGSSVFTRRSPSTLDSHCSHSTKPTKTFSIDKNVVTRRERPHSTKTPSLDENVVTRRECPQALYKNVIIRQERPHTTRRSSLNETVRTRLVLSLDECSYLQLDASRSLASLSLLDYGRL